MKSSCSVTSSGAVGKTSFIALVRSLIVNTAAGRFDFLSAVMVFVIFLSAFFP